MKKQQRQTSSAYPLFYAFTTTALCVTAAAWGQTSHSSSQPAPPVAKLTVFDPPGSDYTVPYAINGSGSIAGYYQTASAVYVAIAFIRDPKGTFTTFAAPGAGTGFYQGTQATGINSSGITTGFFTDASSVFHGFVRQSNGAITEFDAATSASTAPWGINAEGAVAGSYLDASFVSHGFIRKPAGTVTSFDVPGASTSPGAGTQVWAINNSNVVTGTYTDSESNVHGFVRDANGVITTFDAPGGHDTQPNAVNSSGSITGRFVEASGATSGFLRDSDGSFTIFNVPGANGTYAININAGGVTTGFYNSPEASRGFLRSKTGTFATFAVPGAGGGTVPQAINIDNEVTGWYNDAGNIPHGFLLVP